MFHTFSFFVLQYLSNLDKWGVDLFKIAEYSNNRPLTCVTYTILQVSHKIKNRGGHMSALTNPPRPRCPLSRMPLPTRVQS